MAPVLAASPFTTLFLVAVCFMFFSCKDVLARRIGFFLLVSNSLIGIGTALTSLRYALEHPDPCMSEPMWKLVLLPIFSLFSF